MPRGRRVLVPLLVAAVATAAAIASSPGAEPPPEPPRVVIPAPLDVAPRGADVVARVVSTTPIRQLDPARAATAGELAVLGATCSPLLRLDPSDPDGRRLLPGLVDLPLIEPGARRYRLRVLADATFTGGRPVTAEDVAATLRRLVDPALASPWASRFGALVAPGARIAVDGTAVDIALGRADPALPWALALPATCPVPAGTPSTPVEDGSLPGSGAYRVTARSASTVVLERVAGEAGRRGLARRIEVAVATSQEAAIRALAADRADLLVGPLADGLVREAAAARGVAVDAAPAGRTAYLALDVSVPPLDDRTVRAAIAAALDRDALAAAWPGAGAAPAGRLEPPGTAGADAAADAGAPAADAGRARALLGARSGPLVLPLAVPRASRLAALAEPLAAALGAVGIAVPPADGQTTAPLALRLLEAAPALDDAPLGRLLAGPPRSLPASARVPPGGSVSPQEALAATGPGRDVAWRALDAAASAPGWVAVPLVRPLEATVRRARARVVVAPGAGPLLATLDPRGA